MVQTSIVFSCAACLSLLPTIPIIVQNGWFSVRYTGNKLRSEKTAGCISFTPPTTSFWCFVIILSVPAGYISRGKADSVYTVSHILIRGRPGVICFKIVTIRIPTLYVYDVLQRVLDNFDLTFYLIIIKDFHFDIADRVVGRYRAMNADISCYIRLGGYGDLPESLSIYSCLLYTSDAADD